MKPRLIAIVGPTGVGKTALVLRLADLWDIEVISADSRQVYRSLDVGTAKPSPEDRARVPHHLVDVVEPDEGFSLATFLDLARYAIDGVVSRKHLPVVVGGTGQYVWSLLEHWNVPRVPPDKELRRRMELEPVESLFSQLRCVDPVAAEQIGPRNVRRIIRALEVHQHTGTPFSAWMGKGRPSFLPCIIGLTLPRHELYQRLDTRTDDLLAMGWVEEVRNIQERGYSPDIPSTSSTGYRELAEYLCGNVSWWETIRRIKMATHRLVRRQYNWFRLSDPRIRWVDASEDPLSAVAAILRSFLIE